MAITQLGATPSTAVTNVGTQAAATQADPPPPGYDPNNPYGSTWAAYNKTHPQYVSTDPNAGTFNNAYTQPGNPNNTQGQGPSIGAPAAGTPNASAYPGSQYTSVAPQQVYNPYLASLAPLTAYQGFGNNAYQGPGPLASLGSNFPGSNGYANQVAQNLQLQAYAQSQQAAPQINTSGVNFIAGGAGNSLGQANSTNLMTDAAAMGLAGTANGAAAQGQLGTAQQLALTAAGPQTQGQMLSSNALLGASIGPAIQNQMAMSNALAGASIGPAVLNQMATGNALQNAANGPAYSNLMGAGNQLQAIGSQQGLNAGSALYQAAYGQPYQGQLGLANQLANSAYGPTNAGQLSLANRLVAAGAMPTGPSVAELQLKQGADAAMQQQMAMASAARGGNTALALQNAAQNQGQVMGQMNQQQALLRAQEDMQNRQLQASTIGQAAGIYGNAGAQQQQALAQAAGLYGNAGALQGNLLSAATNADVASRGLQANALQGAGSAYGQAGSLQGSLLGAAGQQYNNAGALQGNLLQGANAGYGAAQNQQTAALAAANQGYTAAAGTQGSLLGAANQAYGGALTGQQNAYGQAGNLLQGVAQNQLGAANTQAGLAGTYANMAQAQLQAQTQQNALNQQGSLADQQLALQTQQAERDALMQESNFQQQQAMQQYAIDTGYAQALQMQSNDWSHALIGAGINAVGTLGAAGIAASDIRAKTNIVPASGEVADAFRPLSSSSYFYRDPSAIGAEPGRQYGPMAQQLEQTPAGATAVTQMPNGQKGIDTGRLALLNASATSDMMRRLDRLEGRRPAPQPAYGGYGY